MNVRVLVSENGGKEFNNMKEKKKHSDNPAMVFKENDPNYILVGTDGGIYETFDDTKNWKFAANLPITQFYKLAVDDAYPFYNIFGGTQDNNTQGGPSRTFKSSGITNNSLLFSPSILFLTISILFVLTINPLVAIFHSKYVFFTNYIISNYSRNYRVSTG